MGTKSQPLLGSYWRLKAAERGRVSFNGVAPDILTQSSADLSPKSNWTPWVERERERERGRGRGREGGGEREGTVR